MISLINIVFLILGCFLGLVIGYLYFSQKREESGISNKINDIENLVRELVNNEEENIEAIQKFFGYSFIKAKQTLNLLSDVQIDLIKLYLENSKGGKV